MIKNLMDSNAPARLCHSGGPPQTRGTPVWYARGTPVVAQQQPIVRGRPLTKLRDGPALEFIDAGTRYWDWNAPPDRSITSVALCGISMNFVVRKEINHREHKEYTENAKKEVDLNSPNGEKIRGRPLALRDIKSLTGGQLMILGVLWVINCNKEANGNRKT